MVGDINGFFGLMFDNLTVLSFLYGILVFAFGYPADIVYGRMFPGTAFGVLFGDLVYTWMAFRLARRTGRNVTAMPLGLDTPSNIGLALVVLGPAFVSLKASGLAEREAALMRRHRPRHLGSSLPAHLSTSEVEITQAPQSIRFLRSYWTGGC